MEELTAGRSEGFEALTWLFTCDSRNRGLIRQGFNEAALLWQAVKATSGNILEIGRNLGGSTVLLAAAASPDREIYSIDNRSNEDVACKDYLSQQSGGQVHLLVQDSRTPLPGRQFGFLFVDGDHSFEGVLADVSAHWNALRGTGEGPVLVAFHDAIPNENFKWRDADRKLNRARVRLRNRFRKNKKSEVAEGYDPGVAKVCDGLLRHRLAKRWGTASSMLVLQKVADLPPDFSLLARGG